MKHDQHSQRNTGAPRTARRRGKPRLRDLVAAGAGPWPAPDSALRSRFPVCRVRRAARMVRCRCLCSAAVDTDPGSIGVGWRPRRAFWERDCERRGRLQRV